MITKTETVYVRLMLESHNTEFRLLDTKYELSERIGEVLSDSFYMDKLTKSLIELHPEKFADWKSYRDNFTSPKPEPLRAVAKFVVMDQRVDLVDIRFN